MEPPPRGAQGRVCVGSYIRLTRGLSWCSPIQVCWSQRRPSSRPGPADLKPIGHVGAVAFPPVEIDLDRTDGGSGSVAESGSQQPTRSVVVGRPPANDVEAPFESCAALSSRLQSCRSPGSRRSADRRRRVALLEVVDQPVRSRLMRRPRARSAKRGPGQSVRRLNQA